MGIINTHKTNIMKITTISTATNIPTTNSSSIKNISVNGTDITLTYANGYVNVLHNVTMAEFTLLFTQG